MSVQALALLAVLSASNAAAQEGVRSLFTLVFKLLARSFSVQFNTLHEEFVYESEICFSCFASAIALIEVAKSSDSLGAPTANSVVRGSKRNYAQEYRRTHSFARLYGVFHVLCV